MKKLFTIFGILLLFIVAALFLLRYQTKRVIIGLIEAGSDQNVEFEIDWVAIDHSDQSIELRNVSLLISDEYSPSYKKATAAKVFLDLESLWDLFSGEMLIIEKFECNEATLRIVNRMPIDTFQHPFNLASVVDQIKAEAIRFRIRDMVFNDLTLSLSKDSTHIPTVISHIYARAQNLYLEPDSLLRFRPVVEVNLPKQQIMLPSQLFVGFDSLYFISSIDNFIQILNFEMKSPPFPGTNSYHVQSDEVRMKNFSFEKLYSHGSLVIDSIFLGKSIVSVDWTLIESKQKQNSTRGIPALPRMDIGNITFDKIVSDIIVRKDTIQNTFNVEHASFTMDEFRHRPDSSHVIYSPWYNILVTKYSTLLGKNSTSIRFDTIQIQKRSLSLLNFTYHPSSQKEPLISSPKFELEDVDWYELLLNRMLVADGIIVTGPIIKTTINSEKNPKAGPAISYHILASINEIVKVNRFTLSDATAFIEFPRTKMGVKIRGYHTTLNVAGVLQSEGDVNRATNAVHNLSFSSLLIKNPAFSLNVEKFLFKNHIYSIGKVDYRAPATVSLSLSDVKLGMLTWQDIENTLQVRGLSWGKLVADIHPDMQRRVRGSRSLEPDVIVDTVHGGAAHITFQKEFVHVTTDIDHIRLGSFVKNDSLHLKDLDVKGSSLKVDSRHSFFSMAAFSITDGGGSLKNLIYQRLNTDSIDISIDKLSFKSDIHQLLNRQFRLDHLDMGGVKVRIRNHGPEKSTLLDLETRISATDLEFSKQTLTAASLSALMGPFSFQNTWLEQNKMRGVENETAQRNKFKYVRNDADTIGIKKKNLSLASTEGGMELNLGKLSLQQDTAFKVSALVRTLKFQDFNITTDKLSALVATGALKNFNINTGNLYDIRSLVERNQHSAEIEKLSLQAESGGNHFSFDRMDYNPRAKSGSVHGITFRPFKERRQFLDDSFFQTSYMNTQIESIFFRNLDIKRYLNDNAFHLSSILVKAPTLELGRDKTHPFYSGRVKLLPTNAFQRLKIRFKVDTMKITQGNIAYTETSAVTGKDATVNFTELEALVSNIKNTDLLKEDSMNIIATTRFMDSAKVSLRVRESYYDTLGGFLLATQVSPFHTSILNPVLVPLVSVDFETGVVDTLYMRAVGREYISLGSMKFLYRDLKVGFLNRRDTARHSMKNQLMNFAANAFVVRSNNYHRTGKVFFERDRHRAVFQYWVKMILSGVATSVGAKSNTRQIKRYLKDLNRKKLPAIRGDFDL